MSSVYDAARAARCEVCQMDHEALEKRVYRLEEDREICNGLRARVEQDKEHLDYLAVRVRALEADRSTGRGALRVFGDDPPLNLEEEGARLRLENAELQDRLDQCLRNSEATILLMKQVIGE